MTVLRLGRRELNMEDSKRTRHACSLRRLDVLQARDEVVDSELDLDAVLGAFLGAAKACQLKKGGGKEGKKANLDRHGCERGEVFSAWAPRPEQMVKVDSRSFLSDLSLSACVKSSSIGVGREGEWSERLRTWTLGPASS